MKFQITDDPNYVNREKLCKQRAAEKRIELEPEIINNCLNHIQAQIDNKHYKVEKSIFEQKITIQFYVANCISNRDIGAMGFNPDELEHNREWYRYVSGIMEKVKAHLENNLPVRTLDVNEDEAALLLSQNGMLIKRPLLIDGEKIIIGYQKEIYEK